VFVVCYVAVKLAVWEALLAQYADSIEWVLEVIMVAISLQKTAEDAMFLPSFNTYLILVLVY